MLATNTIDTKIITLLPGLSPKEKKLVLNLVETFTEKEVDMWQDEAFIKELDRRTAEYESGKVKGITMEELIVATRANYKNKRAKKA